MFNARRQFHMESLEPRQMMAASPLFFANGATLANPTSSNVPVAEWVATFPSDAHGPRATETLDPSTLPEPERDLWMGLPLLDSKPGAPITIHLDFTGHSMTSFSNHRGDFPLAGMPIVTPAYDTDYNPTQFGAKEQEEIRQIWARVAEDYAPFNVNVTTHYYGELADGVALKVAIGGHPTDWYIDWRESDDTPSGTSSNGSFSDPDKPNVVFVFSDDVTGAVASGERDNDGRYVELISTIANTASHEAAHAFGLDHLAKFVNGKVVDDYDGGTAEWTPLMGDNLASDRTTWAHGKTDDGAVQDDVQMLTSVLGLRTDDHGNAKSNATLLSKSNFVTGSLSGKGIIEQINDVDMFKFTSAGGRAQITVNAAEFGPNMWVRSELWNESGRIATGIQYSNFQSVIDVNLSPGSYYVLVKGVGQYGHLGQYSVKVSSLALNVAPPLNPTAGTGNSPGTHTPGKPEVKQVSKSATVSANGKSSSDGNSNPIVYSTSSTPSNLLAGSESRKRKAAPVSLGLEAKDAAFATF